MLNTFPLCLTAAAGTEFARDFFFYFERKEKKKKDFDMLPSPNMAFRFFENTLNRNA
jgi:hypothetical protein